MYQRYILIPVFALSGFAALIYESIWAHYLKLMLGHSAYAQLLVLVIFMGGMTLGAWMAQRYTLKIQNLLKLYAGIELVLGILGLIFHSLYLTADAVLQNYLLPHLNQPLIIQISLWTVAALLILPQSMLLGATFPLMSGAYLRRNPQDSGSSLALLYFVNSLGGALGVVFTGFYLVEKSGLPGSVQTAGLINIAIAVLVWLPARQSEMQPSVARVVSMNESYWPKALLLASFITGLSSFLYEIGWVRMLSMVLGSSTHAFELMLSTFIMGLALGSLALKGFIHGLKLPIKTLGLIQMIMGIFALLSLPLYNYLFDLQSLMLSSLQRTSFGYGLFTTFNACLCFLLMFPTTFFAGMTLPLITHILLGKNYGEQSLGRVYAANTIGAILGAILAQLWIMPSFGLKTVIGIGGVFDLVLGFLLISLVVKTFKNLSVAISTGFSLVFAVWILSFVELDTFKMASGVFRKGIIYKPQNSQMQFHQDGRTATVSVMLVNDILSIGTNGKSDASISLNENNASADELTQNLAALLPLSLNLQAKSAAVIGFGSGMTSSILLESPTLKHLDTIEIEPAMVEGARLFGKRTAQVFQDTRSHIICADARSFFLTNHSKYDLIVSEPSNPWVSGTASLFTSEFYSIIKKSLSKNGLFAQWFHLYELSPALVSSVLTAFGKTFPHYTLYFTDHGDILILAMAEGSVLPEISPEIFLISNLKSSLEKINIKSVADLRFRRLGESQQLAPFFKAFPIKANSDFYPILDLKANQDRFLGHNSFVLSDLRYGVLPVLSFFDKQPPIQSGMLMSNNNFPPVIQAREAAMLYQTMVHKQENPTLTGTLRAVNLELSQSERLCAQGPLGIQTWFQNFRALIDRTLPYLNREEMNQLWVVAKPAICYTQSDPSMQQWLNVYEGLLNERYEELLQTTLPFLNEKNAKRSPNDYYHILGINLLAHIKLNRHKQAKNYIEAQNYLPIPAPIGVQLLVSQLID